MVVLNSYDCQIGWKVEAGAYGTIAAAAYNEIPFIKSCSLSWSPSYINVTGFGQRTRRDMAVGKVEDTFSLECVLENGTGESTYETIYDMLWDTAKIPFATQVSFMIAIDTNRDGTIDDDYIYVYGAYLNSITFNGSVGEPVTVSMEFSIQKIDYTENVVAGTSISAIASPDIPEYYDSLFAFGTLSNTNIANTQNWSLTINFNRNTNYGFTNAYPILDTGGLIEITGSVSKDLIGFESITDIEAGTTGTLTITVMTGKSIALSGVNFDSLGLDISEGEQISQEISFTASNITSMTA